MNKTFQLFLFLSIILITMTGCNNKPSNQSNLPVDSYPASEGYPTPLYNSDLSTSYPSDGTSNTSAEQKGPKFTISTPIVGGDTQITGTGPANVPIILIDVTQIDVILGDTTIDANGNFTFDLDMPLKSGHTIGLQIGDLTGTNFNEEDFMYSDSYYVRPLIGILLDMANVE
jgi:hypothetical protein